MKKAFIIIVAIIILAIVSWQIASSWIPRFPTYEQQKQYTKGLTKKADEFEQVAASMPAKWAMYFVKDIFYIPAIKKALNANLYMLKKYPQRGLTDVDILGDLGYEYRALEKYNKAIEMHQRQLEVFKNKYLNKEYPEKEGLTQLQAKTEEYKYVASVHRKIAACYNAIKQYDKGLREYERVLELLPETKNLDKFERDRIFRDTFVTIGKMHKVIFKNYQRAIEIYKRMKEEFPSAIATSEADIFIGDTYLAMGDVKKAKEEYQNVIDTYKPAELGLFNFAENRLRDLREGNPIVATDDVYYEIKDNKVITRLVASKKIMSVSDIIK